jgi:hypothetical protein
MTQELTQPLATLETRSLLSSRRAFLRTSALGGALLALPGALAACSDAATPTAAASPAATTPSGAGVTIDLTTDIGVLNFAYAIEQLASSFYTLVLAKPASDLTQADLAVLADITQHEIVHREFLKLALGPNAIGTLAFDFSKVDLATRQGVLTASKTFEDTDVGAYNGAGHLLKSATNLTIAGKIVSVEARQAAVLRDLLQPKSTFFAGDDVVDSHGLDLVLTPQQVLSIVSPFITTPIHI